MVIQELIGWDLLYKLIEKDIKTEADVIVAIVHWFLIKEGEFRCLGIGDQRVVSENDESSELLPDGWNSNSSSFTLRYLCNEKVFVLLGTVSQDTLVLNLIDSASLQVANVALNVNNTVKALKGSLAILVPETQALVTQLKRDLLDPLKASIRNSASKETQTLTTEQNRHDPLRVYADPSRDIIHDLSSRHQPRIIDPLRDIGRGDLDPLGRGGGGMLFNPPGMPFRPSPLGPGIPGQPGRAPIPGFVPGSRFDPFGPPDPGRIGRMGPDPDHLPPPGYDDMFM